MQKYSSQLTSINTVPSVFKNKIIENFDVILDYGGGKYDTTTAYLRKKGIENLVYDPFNRTELHNLYVLNRLMELNGTSCSVCANVLCVIYEDSVIIDILKKLYRHTRKDGLILIQIYEGDKTGVGKETSKGYQRNQKTIDYFPLVYQVFSEKNVSRKSNLIIIKKV